MQQKEIEILQNMSNAVRFLSTDMITKAKSGHPGLPMGTAELLTTLFSNHLRFNINKPKWENRDKFILSAGHGSAALYSLIFLTGYKDINLNDIKNFRQLHAKTAGHPEYGHLEAIETTTGPLGQGLATSVGMAISDKIKASKLGSDIINNKIYVLAGDGCLSEGISEEAISLAGTLNLNNLIVLWDNNNITIDGKRELSNKTDMKKRFEANGWNIFEIKDGYNFDEIDEVLSMAKKSSKPAFVDVKTIIGKGFVPVENTSGIHGSPLSEEQIIEAKTSSNYPTTPFETPDDVLNNWKKISSKYDEELNNWNEKVKNLSTEKSDFLNSLYSDTSDLNEVFFEIKKDFINENYDKATRNSNGIILEKITPLIKNLVGGTADLAGPTVVKNKYTSPISPDNFDGNFVYYGIREHEMAAALNGLCLGGFKPYGSTFLSFVDYLKPALRLSSIMNQGVINILTHDSIFIGEDGTTHQPIEQFAMLRSQPNLNMIRPADAVEVAESWQIALKSNKTPTTLLFSRQNTPLLRSVATKENMVSYGAYIISDFDKTKEKLITIISTGTEVALSIEVQKILMKEHDINACVVSMPSQYLFEKQSDEYKESIIDDETITISIEAASTFGWAKYAEINIGLDEFGTSAPEKDIREHFGFTPEKIVEKILTEIK